MKSILTFILFFGVHLAHAAMPASVGAIEFADDNTLFIADADEGRIYAYVLPDAEPNDNSLSYNLLGFGQSIASKFDVGERDISYHDIATHPLNGEIWMSMTISNQETDLPVIVRVNTDGEITQVNLDELTQTSISINDTSDDGVKFWRDIPATTLAITDLDYDEVFFMSQVCRQVSSHQHYARSPIRLRIRARQLTLKFIILYTIKLKLAHRSGR